MRRWLYLIVPLALARVAAQPLLSLQFFHSDDGLDHLLRLWAMDRTIQQGVIYPRWLFDLAYGYGYPIFDFYPPLAAYVAETLHLLGLDFVAAIKGTYVICLLAALLGAYAMGAEFFRESERAQVAGVLTAVAYVFFPYFLVDIYARGAIAETLAAALLPSLVWAVQRGLRQPTLSAVGLTAVCLALMLLAHSLTLFIIAPVLIAYVLLELFRRPSTERFGARVKYLAASALLTAGLGAIYWLPFGAELNQIKMGQGIPSIVAIFSAHFLTPSDLIQPSLLYHYGDAPFELGLVAVGLGILALGITILVLRKSASRIVVLFFGGVAIIAAFAMTEPTGDIWLALPLATMVQYPWHVSILIGLGLSIALGALPPALAQMGSFHLSKSVRAPLDLPTLGLSSAIAGAIIWAAIGDLAPQELFFPRDAPTLAQLARFEAYSSFVGTTTWGEYLPATVNIADLLNYHAPATSPSAAQVHIERWDDAARVFQVSASQPISLTLRSFYFPGWQATVDGAPVRTSARTPLGLLTASVPPGDHQVAFVLNNTLPQQAGTLISMASALALATLVTVAWRRRENNAPIAAGILALGLAAFLIPAIAAFIAPPTAREQEQIAVSPALDLIGWSVDNARLQAGAWRVADARASLSLQTFWFARNSTEEKSFTWRWLDAGGQVVSQSEQPSRFGTGNVAAWIPNEVIEDHFDVPLRPALPPGSYTLQVAFGGDFVTVGSVDLERGSAPALAVNIAHPVGAQIGSQIELAGYDAPQTAQPGTRFPLTLYWQAEQRVTNDYTAFVQLLDSDGNVAARPQYDTVPGGGLNPTSLWLPGALVIDQIDFDLPRDLEPGLYRLIAGMYHYPELTRLPVVTADGPAPDDVATLGEVKVPMNVQHASPSHALDDVLGSVIQLNGYDVQVQSTQVAVKLYWQARANIDQDYKVFVHIVDPQSRVVAQQDRLPDAGRYPTRIWDAGEQVIDAYQISTAALAAGRYTIYTGMYSPATGERLPALDQNGRELPNRQIEIAQFDMPG